MTTPTPLPNPIRTPSEAARLQRTPVTGPWLLKVDPNGNVPSEAAVVPLRGIPGRVPGGVHDDLERAGLIPDPFLDANEDAVAWASHTDWNYETTLPTGGPEDAERVDIVFDGIDTVARIDLGGVEIGRSKNMHRSYRYDITELVRGGTGDLTVHLAHAYGEADALRSWVGQRPNAYPEPFNFIRKMACSFGWDWGITLPGAGIWRPVHIETWSTARISGIRPLADVNGVTGTLRALIEVERTDQGGQCELTLEIRIGDTTVVTAPLPPGISHVDVSAAIPNARTWAPSGYGEQHLYPMVTRLRTRQGALLDTDERRIGFRHIRLDRTPDAAGTSFTFRLDGQPILVKGVNWIPGDIIPGRMTRERYATRLRQAAAANVNLIRVWGGGLYETDEFYEICDELGLLVWQDFPFACAAYPETEDLRGEIIAEAEENVARLASHPSLVLWNGNNECQWLRIAEDWLKQSGGDKDWGERYYHEDLPDVLARIDPSRPYTASSPWSGHREIFANATAHGTFHSWDVWNRENYAHYRDSVPRFVSEFGWQAPPAWRTLRDAVTDEPLLPSSPGVLRHQKAAGGMAKLERGLTPHARMRIDFDAWHYLMQWNQVRAIDTGILHWRAHWPTTTGTILWQLNDLWPVISWSAIDGCGRLKPLYFALQHMYAPRALSIQPGGIAEDGLTLVVLNDSDEPWVGEALVRRVADAGFDNARRMMPVDVPPRSVGHFPIAGDLAQFEDPAGEVLVAELDGESAYWYAAEAGQSTFVGAPPTLRSEPFDGGLRIEVTATTLLRDFLVQADRIHPEAVADRGFLTLLPGESATVTVMCPEPLDADCLEIPWATAYLDSVIHSGT
ncbi:MAG: glycoside hydrolase family 2 TIM barrel-domain containing protein [Nakamurella sp.]